MVTGRTSHGESMASLLKNRRPYSLTVSQQPASSAKTLNTLLPEEFSELVLPGPVKYVERSTPMIMKSELDEFFYPLFRRGWEIKRLEANDNSSHSNHASPFLVRKFRFKGNRSARAFLQEIFRIESEEKHHISFNLWSEKRPVITVMTQTHSSRRFDQNTETDHVTTDVIEPGLTLRDIRIAVLLENLLDDTKNLIARVPDSEEHCDADRAAAWQILLSQYPFTS
ncbi:hypothetical protein BYT27DRAFT_7200422 [Phlegmacium glaucopus]|nr:hypothetical protein BYT27DRAFT_7200422 [Phlegmacium glaucopus]